MALVRINRQPSRSQLLVFAVAWLAVVGVIALRAWTREQYAQLVFGGIVALSAPALWVLSPELLRWLFLGLSYATYPLGFALSYVVLGIMYYLVFTPVGLVMRWSGRDPLHRRFERNAGTYWEARPHRRSPASYLRQR